MLGLAAIIFTVLFFITAGYGRHSNGGWGPKINPRWGWFIMECPTVIAFGILFIVGDWKGVMRIAFSLIWLIHYAHRVFIYPFLIRSNQKMPFSIILMGFIFNLVNTYLQGRWLFTLSTESQYAPNWFLDPRFIIGLILFLFGFFLNKQSDFLLRNLRKPGETDYKVPRGGAYRWVSCPNYLGEIIEWIGWAMATWSLAGLVFAVWTIANLVPRAWAHHKWYHEHFEDYPKNRRAIIPFLL
ncbi:MAG: DUF1295 domain-containing protein [Candidatus Heimdallarchaeota archaeon]|nr:DUF1295 domain-containing protein [Candidatus Heimdallarchaeota archaeon]